MGYTVSKILILFVDQQKIKIIVPYVRLSRGNSIDITNNIRDDFACDV